MGRGGPGRAEGALGRKEASEGGRQEWARSCWTGAAEPPCPTARSSTWTLSSGAYWKVGWGGGGHCPPRPNSQPGPEVPRGRACPSRGQLRLGGDGPRGSAATDAPPRHSRRPWGRSSTRSSPLLRGAWALGVKGKPEKYSPSKRSPALWAFGWQSAAYSSPLECLKGSRDPGGLSSHSCPGH